MPCKAPERADYLLRCRHDFTIAVVEAKPSYKSHGGGRSNALRELRATEIHRSPDFLRLANALAVLYPKDSEEQRLVRAILLAIPS